jgi:NADP-dependent 3-hydroxy acid dehydrogenase YdfG
VIATGRNRERLEELASSCELVVGDVNDQEVIQGIVSLIQETSGYPVLINCAGVAKFAPFLDDPMETWQSHLETNVLGPMRLTHAILPFMLDRGGGQIINVSSVAATHSFPGAAVYCTTKAALLAFGRGIATDYRKQGIRVTTLMPGAIDTPIWGDSGPDRAEMLTSESVSCTIRDLVLAPPDRTVDELTIMPVKGFL